MIMTSELINEKHSRISTGMAVVFAIASGIAVGNLYWAQPLLTAIAADFGIAPAQGGILVTATQLGYALGILAIVPLGDVMQRKGLLTAVMGVTVLALVGCALSPSFLLLAMALGCVGLFTVSGQIILPLAGDLAAPEERGRIVGIVTSGITMGILFSRLLSGLVADLWDWRVIYFMAAALNLIMIGIIMKSVPEVPVQAKISYRELMVSVFTSLRRHPGMRPILLKQGMIFGVTFNLFWTALTFLLSEEPFSYSTFQIGLTSLAGITGAIAGVKLGKLQDKGLGRPAMGAFILASVLCMVLAAFAATSIVMIILVAAVFSLATQGVGILSQAQLFSLSDSERSRLNTAFVVSNFLFCAIGSILATALWNMGGWQYVAIGGAIASGIALMIWGWEQK